ncbi:MAG TPA: aminotransferase class V-fold PLP-dependent enzyme, partial [Gemmatimonadaceae bacterium]|nr:aminotransferase class V-fold PLP-dependent enzyme [Gemmatimonadaceae bacterium]
MTLDRRNFIHGVGGLAATAAFSGLGPATTLHTLRNAAPDRRTDLPRKQDFDIADGCTFLNAAYTHPIPRPAADAVRAYLDTRSKLRNPMPGSGGGDGPGLNPKALFAELINAKPSEIAWVPNTSTGENLVLNALGLDRRVGASRGNVVSDWLHYDGALVHLLELKKRGLNVRIVKPTKECRIDLRDIEKVVDKNTKLIQLSSTAMYNGFQHDLKAVCELAH